MLIILLLSSVNSQSIQCLKYKCKPKSMIFNANTCIYTTSDTAYVSACKDSDYCPKVTQGNSTCILKPPSSDTKNYPGEPCERDSDCIYPNCISKICTGKHWLEKCESSVECHVGLYCNYNKICWVQKEEYSRCTSDSECKNNMGCNFWTYSDEGECRKYFSLSKKEWVFNCENHVSLLCKSGSCGGPGGKGVCIDGIKPRYLDPKCKKDEDCKGESYGWQFYSECECGMNEDGYGYCRPYTGDYLGQLYINSLQSWYNSEEINNCHTDQRSSEKCMKTWDGYEDFQKKYYQWRYYPQLQDNKDCVKNALNSFYWDLI